MTSDKTDQSVGGEVSRTSQAVALMRSTLDRPHTTQGDPTAQKRLCTGMKPTSMVWPIAERTRFFDGQVLSAINGGIRQIVICGAGYDDRALRFRTSGVRFFELDHPATQTDKSRRLKAMEASTQELTLISADFRHDDAAEKLRDNGQDATSPTLFICEGLLVYLNRNNGAKLLAGLRSRAAAGSILAASLAVTSGNVDAEKVAASINARRRSGQTEPWLTILPLDAYLALLREQGWQVNCILEPAKQGTKIHGGMTLIAAAPILQ